MWCKFFQKEEAPNLLKIVQFVCSVPVSNAFVERIFSVMGNVWTDERNRLAVNTVKKIAAAKKCGLRAIVVVRESNFSMIKEEEEFLGHEDGKITSFIEIL
ncbi:hypothetical protein TNCV_3545371 [Trichonephila clavipes]|uniref:HAT C-terminal dimerisation domain-containing protein n=1 Tax=Trichonephila clavipes TaxID=2585209 RepID=A0A8X6V355_TRICX|nr:hypothetical protein TNCV_3545371 [Trichonephila clavipes]